MKNKLLLTGIAALSFFFSVKMNAQVAPTASFSLSQPSVCAGGTVQLTDASSDSPTAWSYTVEGPTTMYSTSQNPSFTLSMPGTYSVTLVATNGTGDSSPATETLSVKTLPTVGATGPSDACAGSSVTFNGSGASTYVWTNGIIDGTAFVPTGTSVYTVTGTDAQGCVSDGTVALTVNPLPVLTVNSSANAICIGAAVTLTVSGADTYTWTTGDNTDNIMDSPATSTAYVANGTDAVTGCTNTISKSITVNALPVVTVNSNSVCAGDVFTMTPNGASTYVYSNGSNTITPTANDSYTVTGTDANGCVNAAVANVTVNALPVIAVTGGTLCSGSVFTLAPTGAVTYSYDPSLTATVAPVATTAYSITGVDANGCKSAAAIAEITVSTSPALTVNSGSICSGNVFTITPNSANTVTFSFVNGSSTVSPTSSTNYTVDAEDALGCHAEAVSQVTVVALPVVTVNSGSICSGSIFTMTPNGASTYTFVNGSNTVNPTSNTSYSVSGTSVAGCLSAGYAVSDVTVYALPVVSVSSGSICLGSSYTMVGSGASTYVFEGGSASVSPLTNTTYTVMGVSVEGCNSSNVVTSTVSVWALPTMTITGGSAICVGQTATLTVSGSASTYTWMVSNSNATNYTVNPTANTTYTVIGTDANGCESFTTQALTVNALPVVAVNNGIICPGGSFTIVPTGATSYVYQGGSAIVTPAATTSYSVVGTDANGCTSNAAISTVTVVSSLTIHIAGNTTICQGQTANLTASGATTYSWNATTLTNTIAVNPSTTTNYVVTGMSSGCSNTAAVTVVVNALPTLTVNSTSALLCVGETATITATGAATYAWDNNNPSLSSIVVNPTITTTYTVTGTDANTCSNKTTFVQTVSECTGIAKIDNIAINVGVYPNPTNGEFTVRLTQESSVVILNSIGKMVYSGKFSNGDNTVTLNDQPNGIYFVQLKQGNQSKTVKVVKN